MLVFLGTAESARADYNFNFNSLTPSQSDQATNIANYMDGVIGCGNCVTVSGGVAVAQKYAGEGFVVGPGGIPLTLGNTDGATNNSGPVSSTWDSYISNTSTKADGTGANQLSQQIVITFTHGFSLTGKFSFDYEIFPDGTCPSLSNCGGNGNPNLPDLNFVANGSTPVNTTFWGAAPGTTDGTSTHSPMSGGGTEKAPQLIGTWSGTLTGATSLSFIDWPATIGVDNLYIGTPEPRGYGLLLGGLMLVLFAGTKLRQGLAKSAN